MKTKTQLRKASVVYASSLTERCVLIHSVDATWSPAIMLAKPGRAPWRSQGAVVNGPGRGWAAGLMSEYPGHPIPTKFEWITMLSHARAKNHPTEPTSPSAPGNDQW